MKLLYYTLEGFDTPNPNNHLAETMIDYFLKHELEIHLIQSTRKKINDEIPKRLLKYDNLIVDSVQRKIVDKQNFIHRYIEESMFGVKTFKKWFTKRKSYDELYVQSNATIVWSIILFKIFIRKPINYVIYDIFPGQSMSLGIIKSKFLYSLFRFIQSICYKMADKIVVLSEDMKNSLIELNVKHQKIHVIYPWYDESVFKPIPKEDNEIFDKLNLDLDKFYVQYAGSIGQNFDVDLIIEISKKLQDLDSNIKLLLIGNGANRLRLEEYILRDNLQNIVLHDLQSLDVICQVYNACDLGIIPLNKNVIKYGFPSKACQLLACGKPIITSTDDSSYANLINNGLGYADINYDANKIAEKIKFYKDNLKDLEMMRQKSIEYAQKNYTCENNCDKLFKILGGI